MSFSSSEVSHSTCCLIIGAVTLYVRIAGFTKSKGSAWAVSGQIVSRQSHAQPSTPPPGGGRGRLGMRLRPGKDSNIDSRKGPNPPLSTICGYAMWWKNPVLSLEADSKDASEGCSYS